MRILISLVVFLWMPPLLQAQESLSDKISLAIKQAPNDSMKFIASQNAAYYWVESNRDSLLFYVNQCITLAQNNSQELEEAWGLASRGYCLTGTGEYSKALTNFLKAFAIVEDPKYDDQKWLPPGQTGHHHRLYYQSYTHHLYAILMARVRNYEEAIHHFQEAKRIAQEINVLRGIIWADMNLGVYYLTLNKPDSALLFCKNAKDLASKTPGEKKYLGLITSTMARIALKQGNEKRSINLFHEAVQEAIDHQNQIALTNTYRSLATIYFDKNEKDSSLWYARKAFESLQAIGKNTTPVTDIGGLYENLFRAYLLNGQPDSALHYAGLSIIATDSISNNEITNLAEFQKKSLGEQLRLQNLEKEKVVYQSKVRIYTLFSGLGVFLLLAVILFRNNRKTKKTNKILEQALFDLKSTQGQLIQSEKMASLGELTAGIAHEIQNPLNFVNNFSEINKELIGELRAEIKKGNLEGIGLITQDIEANEEKISHHGKRADSIVKGMLQHSRSSSGVRELTNINTLADEYLRLSYHGLRAKDKTFNAALKTDYDETIGNINVVPQEFGRVILNLVSNAFYAVNEKSSRAKASADNHYEPTVVVTTKKSGNKVLISVRDNGNGVPQKVLNKIFQPFFTTKPTGQGTGLGLSLSYDIVKAHGGEIKVDTKEGEATEFIILLPVV